MKSRTIAIAGAFGRVVGLCFGTALMVIAIAETIYGVSAMIASEVQD